MHSFQEYLISSFPSRNSGAANSYLIAIKILDEIFKQRDIFNLQNHSLTEIDDPLLIAKIVEFIVEEEDKFKKQDESIFDLGKATQTSYPRKGFCRAAVHKLEEYINLKCSQEASKIMEASEPDGKKLSTKLLRKYKIYGTGSEKDSLTKRRIGQHIFRAMLLTIYHSKCCLTGIDIPDVL